MIFACAKTKVPISFAVTVKPISAFVFTTWIVQFLPKFQDSVLNFFWECTGQFVSDWVGNPEDHFANVVGQKVLSCVLNSAKSKDLFGLDFEFGLEVFIPLNN